MLFDCTNDHLVHTKVKTRKLDADSGLIMLGKIFIKLKANQIPIAVVVYCVIEKAS